MTRPSAERYVLTIESTRTTSPATIRLKGVLKSLLRGWGFRCVEVREVENAANLECGPRDAGTIQ